MVILPFVFLVVGFALLVKGADWLVDGASSVAKRFGISDLFIGLTIVAFGTSMPELIVNIIASVQGKTDIAIGNVVGSNVANILLILGATALLSPLRVQSSTVRKEIPFSLLAAFALIVMANDGLIDGYGVSELSRSDGLVLMGFFAIFLYYTFGIAKSVSPAVEEHVDPSRSTWLSTLMVVGGIAAMTGGGKLAIDGAVRVAGMLGISDSLIGLTVVAVGTSLPELVSSIVAARRGKADIAVGNAVGSNVFNIFWILGISAVIKPLPFSEGMNVDLAVVGVATFLLLLAVHNGHVHRRLFFWWKQKDSFRIRAWEGAVLLASYAAYLAYAVWRG
jgi:cation:H+ antiporter